MSNILGNYEFKFTIPFLAWVIIFSATCRNSFALGSVVWIRSCLISDVTCTNKMFFWFRNVYAFAMNVLLTIFRNIAHLWEDVLDSCRNAFRFFMMCCCCCCMYSKAWGDVLGAWCLIRFVLLYSAGGGALLLSSRSRQTGRWLLKSQFLRNMRSRSKMSGWSGGCKRFYALINLLYFLYNDIHARE